MMEDRVLVAGQKSLYMKALLALLFMQAVLLADMTRDDSTGIVVDSITELMWQDNTSAAGNWDNALATCEAMNLGGYEDWRLPNRNEILSIIDWERYNPAMNPEFVNVSISGYWTSSSSTADYTTAWYVEGLSGKSSTGAKSTTYYVRCVRGGL